jgi:hypothetical protein
MTFLIGVVNSINCQVEPNLHLENFHFPIFLKPAVLITVTDKSFAPQWFFFNF